MSITSKRNPLVSILIVAFNAQKYIRQTVKSCIDQTYGNTEILILDNNSTDNTVNIIKAFHHPSIHILRHHSNSGPYAGLNILLSHARGQYIAIQDHDDIWLSTKLEKQIAFLEKNTSFIACGTQSYLFYEEKKLLILPREPFMTDFVGHPSLVFHNTGLRYNEGIVLADEDFEKKVLRQHGQIACLDDALIVHRIKNDGTNLSTRRFTLNKKQVKDFFRLNKVSYKTFLYFFSIISYHYLPNKIRWYIRKHVSFKKAQWLTLEAFSKLHPEVEL